MAEGSFDQIFDLTHKYFSTVNVTSRATLSTGGYVKHGNLVIVNVRINGAATATNSPQVLGELPAPRMEIALNCIDITEGIGSAITGSIPCGMATGGQVYMKEITNAHVYVISGCYISDS